MNSEWDNLNSERDNPSVERRTNPVAKLFKAVWAWHFLTKIGLFFLIWGTVDVLLAEDLGRSSAGGRIFYGVVLVFLGFWRKRRPRRPTSRGIFS